MGLFPASSKNGTAFSRLHFGIFKKLSKNNTFFQKFDLNQNDVVTKRGYLGLGEISRLGLNTPRAGIQ